MKVNFHSSHTCLTPKERKWLEKIYYGLTSLHLISKPSQELFVAKQAIFDLVSDYDERSSPAPKPFTTTGTHHRVLMT